MKLKHLIIFNTFSLFLNIREPNILSWGRKAFVWHDRTSECHFCAKFDFLLIGLFAVIVIVIS